jgi:hypothetical protein
LPSTGGSRTATVTAAAGCNWTATSNVSWITITAGASGSGNGTVSYSVAANSSTVARTGTLTVAGQTVSVSQAGSVVGAAITVTGAGVNSATGTSLRAEATFSFDSSTMDLTVQLTNTSTDDVRAASDVLTAVYFNVNNNPSFTPVSATIPAGTVVFGPDGGGNVGGEWAYAEAIIGPNLAGKGISSAAFGIFGNANLRGLDLDGTIPIDNHSYGITSASDNPATGDAAVTGAVPLIKNSVRFRVKSAVILDPTTVISNVSFQYGTITPDPNLPGR